MTDLSELNDKSLKKVKMKDITDSKLIEKLETINVLLKNFNRWMKTEIKITNKELKKHGVKE